MEVRDRYITVFREYLQSLGSINKEELKEKENEQLNWETEYLKLHPPRHRINRNWDLSSYDGKKMHELLQKQFYNPALLELVSSITDYIVLMPEYDDLPGKQLRLRTFITDLKKISEGTYGTTMEASLKYADKDFIIKVPKRDEENAVHEFFVGLAMSGTRQMMPNFVYTYAGFVCSPPFIDRENNEVINYCAKKQGVQYIVQERIPGNSLFNTEDLTLSEFIGILLQLLFALAVTGDRSKFTHYDLHSGNILLRKGKNEFSLRYVSPNGNNIFVKTNYVATIIDFGRSFISFNGKPLGYFFPERGIYPQYFPLYDIFTLLRDCFVIFPQFRNITEKLLSYFDIDDYRILMEEYVFLPPIPEYLQRNTWSFIGFFRDSFPDLFAEYVTSEPTVQVLNCSESECLSDDELIYQLHVVNGFETQDPFDIWDLIYKYPDADWDKMVELGDYEDYFYLKNIGGDEIATDPNLWNEYYHYLKYLATKTQYIDNLLLVELIYRKLFLRYPEYEPFDFDQLYIWIAEQDLELESINEDYFYLQKLVEIPDFPKSAKFMEFYQMVKDFHYQTYSRRRLSN